ncbi:MAG: hypothetical protein HC901_03540 [Bdellovibrionaceae bacterium]|nr:hypothetical protein [Pseudobdellovibrionaceae bacterium]
MAGVVEHGGDGAHGGAAGADEVDAGVGGELEGWSMGKKSAAGVGPAALWEKIAAAGSAFGGGFLEEGEAGALVFSDDVACGEGVDGAFLGLAGKEIEGDHLAALEFLVAGMEEVGFSAFFC